MKIRVLYVDDEKSNLITFESVLSRWFDVKTTDNPTEVMSILKSSDQHYDMVVTDQRMPQLTGLELAEKITKEFPYLSIIILTAFDDSEIAMKAVNQGGIFRYILKPWDLVEMKQTLTSAAKHSEIKYENRNLVSSLRSKNRELLESLNQVLKLKKELEKENIYLKEEFSKELFSFSNIISKSDVLLERLNEAVQAAKTDATILLLGETGTGKELFANAIHANSKRSDEIIVKVNCAAIPENLVESELFGHEKGAFTGADKQKIGKFELANRGTIFLDEVGELDMAAQSKLLRVLQEKELEKVGGSETIKLDIRVIAATNRDLKEYVKKGKFREDLFYRLNVIPIKIPPLRDRKEDISLLVEYFIQKNNRKTGKNITSIEAASLKKLEKYDWPGNIRELENIIERAHVLSAGRKLKVGSWFAETMRDVDENDKDLSLNANERNHIIKVLKKTKWKIRGKNGAAEILELPPSTLESKMKKLEIKRPT
jgi:formate hydrogenlyase transcriptional activator